MNLQEMDKVNSMYAHTFTVVVTVSLILISFVIGEFGRRKGVVSRVEGKFISVFLQSFSNFPILVLYNILHYYTTVDCLLVYDVLLKSY